MDFMGKIKLIDQEQMKKMISRISHEIIESCSELDNVSIIGIKTRGEFLAKRIRDNIQDIKKINIPFGTIDITFHRDDFRTNLGTPKVGPSKILFDIDT